MPVLLVKIFEFFIEILDDFFLSLKSRYRFCILILVDIFEKASTTVFRSKSECKVSKFFIVNVESLWLH